MSKVVATVRAAHTSALRLFRRAARLIIAIGAVTTAVCAHAAVLLETAPQGTTNGGTAILATQFLGARFTLTNDFHITSLGGHFKGEVGTDRSIFIALVEIASPSALPSLADLGDPIFATSFLAPYNDVGPYPNQVPDTLLATDFDLAAGSYVLIVGSGLFGATGAGWMPSSGPIQELPWFVTWNGLIDDDFVNRNEQPVRFLVNGCYDFPGGGATQGCFPGPGPFPAPEPATLALACIALPGIAAIRRRRL